MKKVILSILFFLCAYTMSFGQTFVPPNIDFETGTLAGWTCHSGTVATGPVYTLSTTLPLPKLHTLTSGSGMDLYGGFPVRGQGSYSLKLARDTSNFNADAASFYVRIPANGNYELIYYYAAVLQSGGHAAGEEPSMQVAAIDSITDTIVPTSSVFFTSYDPGFLSSGLSFSSYYKPWSKSNLRLTGCSDRTLKMRFTAAGCSNAGHWGYGYFDVSCIFCRSMQLMCGDLSANLNAPPGYVGYIWTDSLTFSSSFGTTQNVIVTAPIVTTTYAVILTPVTGPADTMYTTILPPVATSKSSDTTICLGTSISITAGASSLSPLTYLWTPSTGLSCTTCDTTIATPPLGTTSYFVSVSDTAGCSFFDSIRITVLPAVSGITGTTSICSGTTTTLTSTTTGGTWSSTSPAVASVDSTTGVVTGVTAGTATIVYTLGCSVATTVTVYPVPAAILGDTVVCAGSIVTLSDTVAGGIWSSSNTSIAIIHPTAGVLIGSTAGTTTISYTIGPSCVADITVTINPTPAIMLPGLSHFCVGTTNLILASISGGTWTSNDTSIATIGPTSGIITGISPGYFSVNYVLANGCYANQPFRIDPLPPAIAGVATTCTGGVTLLSDAISGGTWTSSNTSIASINMTTGVLTGISTGTATITYTISTGCTTDTTATVTPVTAPILGSSIICVGSAMTLSDATPGGVWSSSDLSLATIGTGTGLVSGIAAGTVTISYTLSGMCTVVKAVTVSAVAISLSTFASCGGSTLTCSGGTTYTWLPSAGLSCTTCSTTVANPLVTTTYTVTGTSLLGCPNTDTITINGNRIFGHVTLSGGISPIPNAKVWLIQFNPIDSSIVALDSTYTCDPYDLNYYEFAKKPPGTYMTKAMLIYGSTPGSSGYIPAYSYATPYWYAADTVGHTTTSDSLNIVLAYGTVPPGPGFISGYVYSGAGKGTAGESGVPNIMVYLRDVATGNVLTYTFTDAAGYYYFSGLAHGSYVIYPEEFKYTTIPSGAVAINSLNETITGINFKKYVGPKFIITPVNLPNTKTNLLTSYSGFTLSPNPTTGAVHINWQNQPTGNVTIAVTDVTGREMYRFAYNISTSTGNQQFDISHFPNGIYSLTITSNLIQYNTKLQLQK